MIRLALVLGLIVGGVWLLAMAVIGHVALGNGGCAWGCS